MDSVKPQYDVVIVGSGPGGSTLAHALSHRGVNILMIDEGDFLKPDASRGDAIGIFMGDYQVRGQPPVQFIGGDSKFYGAALYRLRESDFRETPLENGVSPAWPISYAELEPYYTEAERLYSVHGSAEGDPTEPPRSAPFPHGPIAHEPLVAEMVERIRQQGVPVSHIPKAVDASKCVLCPTCDSFYCQRDAKMDAEVAALRPALRTGKVQLLTRTKCLQVLTTPDGRKTTGVLIERGTEQATVKAGVVVLSAGVEKSPLILWRSRNAAHPNGLGNASGQLGRNLAGHTAGLLFPMKGLSKVPALHQKTFAINAFYEPSAEWPYPSGVIQAAGQVPFWKYMPGFMRPFVRFITERSIMCFLMTEAVGSHKSGLVFEGERVVHREDPAPSLKTYERLRRVATDIFRRAGYRVLSPPGPVDLWHPVGTARFGEDPATSVLDPSCRVHGMDNLYVVDSCFLPSAGAVNTSLTVMAMALRTANTIARVN